MQPTTELTPKRRLYAPSPTLCGVTDTGLSRDNNEDEFYLSNDGRFWIVADGMGGQAAGEVASALTIGGIRSVLEDPHADPDVEAQLLNALREAHARVLAYALEHPECAGMGGAVAATRIEGDVLHVCHAGDVRCYVYRRGVLERLTDDHSLVAQMVRGGLLTSAAAAEHPDRGRLEQAVGVPKNFAPALNTKLLADRDRVLICSDGLWEPVGDTEICSVLSSDGSMRQIATVLADRANAAGGPDNITAVVYEHSARCE